MTLWSLEDNRALGTMMIRRASLIIGKDRTSRKASDLIGLGKGLTSIEGLRMKI
jgi:hypothetical protein